MRYTKIPTSEHIEPVKQKLQRLKPELSHKEELIKLLKNGFIESIAFPSWLANIVLVSKEDGKLKGCMDYRNMNGVVQPDTCLSVKKKEEKGRRKEKMMMTESRSIY